MDDYYIADTLKFRLRNTPFPMLDDIDGASLEPGQLLYRPVRDVTRIIEIVDGPRSNPGPVPDSYRVKLYYWVTPNDAPDFIPMPENSLRAMTLRDEYVPVPQQNPQQTLPFGEQ
jgi:hypothetical protein